MYSYKIPVTTTVSSGSSTWQIIALVLAIVGAFAVYFAFLPKKNENKFTGFVKWLYNFYLILAIYVTLSSFGFIGTSALAFFGMLIVGNLVLRISFEASLMLIMIYKNTKEINEKTK